MSCALLQHNSKVESTADDSTMITSPIEEEAEHEIDLNGDDEPHRQHHVAETFDSYQGPVIQGTPIAPPSVVSAPPASLDVQSSSSISTASRGVSLGVTPVAGLSSITEGSDQSIEVSVGEPKKIGDGYGSYVVYKVTTKTNLPFFRRQSFSVNRRFSDFWGLRDKLAEKHLHVGRIVPPAPEKDAVGTAKVKMSKDGDIDHDEFIGKRRLALERFLNRTASHPTLRADPDFREFLELETDLPKASGSSALSGAGVRRLLNKFGDTVNKMTFKMEEADMVSILLLIKLLLSNMLSANHERCARKLSHCLFFLLLCLYSLLLQKLIDFAVCVLEHFFEQ